VQKKKKGLAYFIEKGSEDGLFVFFFPVTILALSFINFCCNNPINIYLFFTLFILSALFAFFSREGAKMMREEQSKTNQND
jgi:ABC-type transport system involved in cytochrome bd biosynthesis fused ATPase/permease subunit